ncbi:MAG: twitching motility protein PilT [Planctomycetota bacterium]|nr:MAG: twitching motility protein PilT [Planctomycetota bacterium]
MDLPSLLLFARDAGGSDLHLSAGAPVMLRVSGEMRKLALPGSDEPVVHDQEETRKLIYDLLTDAQKKKLEEQRELDFALAVGLDARFRGNVFIQERGLAAVFRVVPTAIKSFEELGLPEPVRRLSELDKGLVLVTGPTGSGKSTTLAAMVDSINSRRRGHIITIEDPIEFVHPPKLCMVNQREVGAHTHGFANALRSALREDPDVILVGEMRDLETIALAITAAETGHLVLGTLHTASAAKTIDRIINVFPAGEQAQIRAMLADSLAGVVAQLLLPRRGGGRVAALEVLVATPGVRAMIRDGKTHQIPSAIQTGQKYGMQSLEQALSRLVLSRQVEQEVAHRALRAAGLLLEEEPPAAGGEGGGRPARPSPYRYR